MRQDELKSLYVATNDYTTLTKVGVSNNPIKRLNSIKTAVGAEMFIYYESPLLENWKHVELSVLDHFKSKRISGEWVNETPENIIAFIKTIENTFNNIDYYPLAEYYIEPNKELISEETETPYKKFQMNELIDRELIYIGNGVYRDEIYNFFVCYHLGNKIKTVIFNVYKTSVTFAKTIPKRIVLLDLDSKKYIKNPKFRIKDE